MTTDKIYPHWREEQIKDHMDLPSFQVIEIRFSFKQRSKGMYKSSCKLYCQCVDPPIICPSSVLALDCPAVCSQSGLDKLVEFYGISSREVSSFSDWYWVFSLFLLPAWNSSGNNILWSPFLQWVEGKGQKFLFKIYFLPLPVAAAKSQEKISHSPSSLSEGSQVQW